MKRVCSIFSRILQLIPRDRFEAAVERHQAERHSRGFSSWGQLVTTLFCQFGAGQIAAGDHGRVAGQRRETEASGIAGSAGAVDAGVRQQSPALAVVRDRIRTSCWAIAGSDWERRRQGANWGCRGN
jgi:hypothetical protein